MQQVKINYKWFRKNVILANMSEVSNTNPQNCLNSGDISVFCDHWKWKVESAFRKGRIWTSFLHTVLINLLQCLTLGRQYRAHDNSYGKDDDFYHDDEDDFFRDFEYGRKHNAAKAKEENILKGEDGELDGMPGRRWALAKRNFKIQNKARTKNPKYRQGLEELAGLM